MTLRYLPSAQRDIDAIYDYLSIFDAAAADRQIDRFEEAVDRLRMFPLSAPARPEFGEGKRGMVCGHYVIVYSAETHGVDIAAVVHMARDQR